LRTPDLRHVLDRHLDGELQRLLRPGVDDGDGAISHGAAMRRELALDLGIDLFLVVARAFQARGVASV
jgi:hypothetical protein